MTCSAQKASAAEMLARYEDDLTDPQAIAKISSHKMKYDQWPGSNPGTHLPAQRTHGNPGI